MIWFNSFVEEFYVLTSEMAPYLLLGFLFAGILKAWFPSDRITRFMGKRSFSSVLNAALLGVPMPLCSCGVIPTGVSFFRNGASRGATTSFLISTPQTGVDSVLATYALLGLPFAIIRPVVALATGLIGGVLSNVLQPEQSPDQGNNNQAPAANHPLTIKEKLKITMAYGFGELVEDIVKWLLIGLAVAALLSVIIPDDFFTRYIGNPWLEMGMVLLASVPLYICATGSIPLAVVFLMKGLSPGAALVFLMAGPATNVATMMVIGKTMGRKSLIIYLLSIIGGAVFFGMIINHFLPASWFNLFGEHAGHQHGSGSGWIKVLSTIVLAVMVVLAIWKKWLKTIIFSKKMKANNISSLGFAVLNVEGMTCNHCKMSVEKRISGMEGVTEVIADPVSNEVRIKGDGLDTDRIGHEIEQLGYQYKGLK